MIETVLGPLSAAGLGVTSMHDHVLADSSRLHRPGRGPAPAGDKVTVEMLGHLRWNQLALADNLRLDDPELAVEELSLAVAAGQRAVVDATSWGLGPSHAALPEIARRSGMTIVCSYGTYLPRTLPSPIAALGEAELEDDFYLALTDAVPGTGYRAGLLGIMGTTGDVTAEERMRLRAGARAAARAGAALTVRLDQHARPGLDVLALCTACDLPPDRVVFTNADEYLDAGYWAELTAAGAVLEMCFGTEAGQKGRVENPSDQQRLAFFRDFLADHPQARFVLGGSTWTKAQLRHYGGYGYEHLLGRIVPELLDDGVSESRVAAMLVEEPRRLLDRGERAV
ncbi:phosphotriesterase [Cryptosporangium sp. NPDC051539]|uniref:phosphotriesterase family protein n=1 Tax=Cryptosporangium sp. NPDC051539 TaxID=3363962 RepID=UPI0037A24CBC